MNQNNLILVPFLFFTLLPLLLALFPPVVIPVSSTAPIITDMADEKVQADLPSKRLVIFPMVISSYLTINQGSSHLLATSPILLQDAREGLLGRIYSLKNISLITGVFSPRAVDVENIMLLHPDAVISNWTPGIPDPLKAVNTPGVIEVTYLKDNRGREWQWPTIWRVLGHVTNCSERVEWLLQRYGAKHREVLSELNATGPKRTHLAVMTANAWAVYLATDPGWIGSQLDAVGAHNIAAGEETVRSNLETDPEEILKLNPQTILILCNSGARDCLKNAYDNPLYQSIDAVRNRRIYQIPDYSFPNQFVEEPLFLRWLAEVLYPDKMARKLRTEYRETYQEVYRYALTDDQIDQAVHLKENMRSQGYDRFARSGSTP
jgi:iron complex transport system substrate-binding protein